MSSIKVSEIFVSIQGEGDTVGRLALFIRVQGCPLDCVWCDTKYSVPFEGGNELSSEELAKIIKDFVESKKGIVIFTGGEPLFYQDAISEVLSIYSPYHVEFETSGIYLPSQELGKYKFNVSPKLSSARLSGGEKVYQKIYENLREFAKLNSIFKFVISYEYELEEVVEIQRKYGLPRERIFLMPEGTTPEEITDKSKFIIPFCFEHGFNYSPRLQIMLKIK
jgi:7-carboxy-7-deazaguanine synthase